MKYYYILPVSFLKWLPEKLKLYTWLTFYLYSILYVLKKGSKDLERLEVLKKIFTYVWFVQLLTKTSNRVQKSLSHQ